MQDLPFLANRKVTLPFGVKEQGHEEMDVIPQVQERPDSFLLSCCERRVKCHSAPNLCFPPQEAWQSMEGGRTHRAVFPPLLQVGLEGQGLHRQACEVGGEKT